MAFDKKGTLVLNGISYSGSGGGSRSSSDKSVTRTTTPLDASADGTINAITLKGNSYKSKNLLDCSGLTTQTINGVTFTPQYNANGQLEYINVNGTASGDINLKLGNVNISNGKEYILTSGHEWVYSKYGIYIDDVNASGSAVWRVSQFVAEASGVRNAYLRIANGNTLSNVIFYPMLRLATETNADYEPYGIIIPSGDVVSQNADKTKSSTIHTDRPLLSVNDVRNELIIDKDGNGTFTERVILQNDELVVKPTPTTENLTPQEIAHILSLKTFDGNTYIDTDGCPFEITYNVNATIGTLYDKTEDLQKQIDDIGEIYSEEETRIGTYLGKPLYRKVVVLSNIGASNYMVVPIASDMTIKNFYGVAYKSNNWIYSIFSTEGLAIPMRYDPSNNGIVGQNKSQIITRLEVTVEYTKTTD